MSSIDSPQSFSETAAAPAGSAPVATPAAPSVPSAPSTPSAAKPDFASVILALTPLLVPIMQQALQVSPEGKPGWKTTEFLAVLFGSGSSIVAAFGGWVPPHIAVVLTAALGALYLMLRVWQKVRTAEAMAITIDPQAITAGVLANLEKQAQAPLVATPDAAAPADGLGLAGASLVEKAHKLADHGRDLSGSHSTVTD